MSEFEHVTVLLHEAVALLDIKPEGLYVDATLGGGARRAVKSAVVIVSHAFHQRIYIMGVPGGGEFFQ